MNTKDKAQLKLEIDHIFESGANEIRIQEMVEAFINKRYEAIDYAHSYLQLKDKETMTFWEWAAHNKLETKNDEVLYNEIWYYLPDLVRKYEREIKDNL